jgi:hypothetical protein
MILCPKSRGTVETSVPLSSKIRPSIYTMDDQLFISDGQTAHWLQASSKRSTQELLSQRKLNSIFKNNYFKRFVQFQLFM